jgi:hypothetical protein
VAVAVAPLGEADGDGEDVIDGIDEGAVEDGGEADPDGEGMPDGEAVVDGETVPVGEADEDALPVTATLVTLVHSIGRK